MLPWLPDIFTQYGDHLYSKGDHDGAIDQYIKTIGKLEASYVIRKVRCNHGNLIYEGLSKSIRKMVITYLFIGILG